MVLQHIRVVLICCRDCLVLLDALPVDKANMKTWLLSTCLFVAVTTLTANARIGETLDESIKRSFYGLLIQTREYAKMYNRNKIDAENKAKQGFQLDCRPSR